MFLKEFNKDESIAFANLIKKFVEIDDVVAKKEKRLIAQYFKELNIKEDSLGKRSYTEIIAVLKNSKERIRRICYFELVGLALVDGNYGDTEIDFLDKIAVDLDINRAKKISFANFFYSFKKIHDFSLIETNGKELEVLKKEAESLM